MQIMWFSLFFYVLHCSPQDLLGDLVKVAEHSFQVHLPNSPLFINS